jgi:hypothetical protein
MWKMLLAVVEAAFFFFYNQSVTLVTLVVFRRG